MYISLDFIFRKLTYNDNRTEPWRAVTKGKMKNESKLRSEIRE